jgi:hypothetical protein
MSSAIVYWTAGVLRSAELGTATSARCQPKVKIIGNGRKWSEVIGNGQKRSEAIGIGHVTYVACDAITWSSANGAEMRKYTNSELWGSSPPSIPHRMLPTQFFFSKPYTGLQALPTAHKSTGWMSQSGINSWKWLADMCYVAEFENYVPFVYIGRAQHKIWALKASPKLQLWAWAEPAHH